MELTQAEIIHDQQTQIEVLNADLTRKDKEISKLNEATGKQAAHIRKQQAEIERLRAELETIRQIINGTKTPSADSYKLYEISRVLGGYSVSEPEPTDAEIDAHINEQERLHLESIDYGTDDDGQPDFYDDGGYGDYYDLGLLGE